MSNLKIIDFATYRQNRQKRECDNMCDVLERIKGKSPEELLIQYNMLDMVPVDIHKLVDEIGIKTYSMDFKQLEDIMEVEHGAILGAAISSEDKLSIFYKGSDSLHRKKFTVAHELAHCCLHCPDNTSEHIEYRWDSAIWLNKEEWEKEKEANVFAGQLLIPQKMLKKYYDQMVIPSLSGLAQIFDVSTSVMEARLNFLGWPYYKDSKTETITII